ncbi:GAF domain-containing protein [Streptomyces sp. Wb2n-11]|uniref:GAF domain-containing protein n=1 Tax=Streptomyces sp. Wb2n-11 TaxID=1030533 RepID=UPI000B23AAA8|nr:GAF domain-containing protein [Streptomyces sp. Wb2n-11]
MSPSEADDLSSDPTGHLRLNADDRDAPARIARLRELGLRGDSPVPEFDHFARDLAHKLGARYAMVNFIDEHRQFFAGLYTPDSDRTVELAPQEQQGQVGREMALDYGFCPHVVLRRKAFPLEDVFDYPRFAGNPVVNELGIRTYLGTPLIDPVTDMPLGTICVVDTEARQWGSRGVETIKFMAQQLVDRIHNAETRGRI